MAAATHRSLFIQARGVLKKELVAHLRRMRRSKYASREGQGRGGDGEGDGARARGPGLPIAEQAAD